MGMVVCPQCHLPTKNAGYPLWVIIVAVCLFPVGMLACLAGRKPTTCKHCGLQWKTD